MSEYPLLRLPIIALLAVLSSAGCAANATSDGNGEENTEVESTVDPWESVNRDIFRFNRSLDKAVARPIAQGYVDLLPSVVRRGLGNFSTNLRAPRNIVNNFLQGKARRGLGETGRFLVNSTLGLLGTVDVASDMGLEPQPEDFGQTLAVWGVPDGPYVMVPFAGPQTLRGVFAFPIDVLADPLWYYENDPARYGLYALRFIDIRSDFLSLDKMLDESFDPYIRMREAYLQNRRFAVYDGNPPVDDDFYDDIYDDLPEPDPLPEDEQP